MRGWKAERRIVAGRSRTEALTVFEEGLNKRVRRRMRKLKPLRDLLSEPITAEQARALVDVARCRRSVEDLVGWLRSPAVTWGNFPRYQEYEEEFRGEREPLVQMIMPLVTDPGELERIRAKYRQSCITEFLPKANPCLRCGTPPEYLDWYQYSPPGGGTGWSGWGTRCKFCLAEIDHFDTIHQYCGPSRKMRNCGRVQ
jgi:hypothetical protein